MKHYTVTYDDGKAVYLEGDNAPNAIFEALKNRPGHKVIRCRVGKTEAELKALGIEHKGFVGFTEYEVPPHEPYKPELDNAPLTQSLNFGFKGKGL